MAVNNQIRTPIPAALVKNSPEFISDVCLQIPAAHPSDNLSSVLKRFQTEKGLLVLPVVEEGRIVGILNRSIFLEEHVIGMHGYAFQINHAKKMRDLMISIALVLEAATPIRIAAQAIQKLGENCRIDNVCVTRNGSYEGIVDVNRFISAITEINLGLAKGANPLTGLPGNESIQREINELLRSGKSFDIAYVDIDNFKPYNDYYGFQKGDVVIKLLGEIITTASLSVSEDATFCGHIGGDDFIVITEPHKSHSTASQIIQSFEKHHLALHGSDDFAAGCYTSINRKGESETFPLLSLSIGIVNTLLTPVDSYGQLASLSTEVKRLAKKQPGSSIVLNRRARGMGISDEFQVSHHRAF
jgi:diguanylate cyclase (GGDEF)-like protein